MGIRTLVCDSDKHKAAYGVGSGIVWDSDGDSEWRETLDKAKILATLQNFELLETMVYHPGEGIYLLDFHLQRLQRSAEHFHFDFVSEQIDSALGGINESESKRVRLLLSRDGSIRIELAALSTPTDEVVLGIAVDAVNSTDVFLQHKTTNRQTYEQAKAEVPEVDDVILWNERGELTETTIYNLFLEIGGELLTSIPGQRTATRHPAPGVIGVGEK